MKKTIILAFLLMMTYSLPANAAQKVKVSALTPFSSLNPSEKMKVITLEKAEFNNGIIFENGTVIYGDIIEVKQPKRAKRNASFKFKPTSYLYNGEIRTVNDPNFIAKYAEYKELNKAELATSAAATAGGFIFHIPLLSEGVSFVKGVIKNPEDNRFKSGAVQVYKDSPLSYIEEGKDIDIQENTMFILKFKSSDLEDLDDDTQEEAQNEETSTNPTVEQENTAPEEENNSKSLQAPSVPVVSQAENPEEKPIKAINPDEVLREVELNSK